MATQIEPERNSVEVVSQRRFGRTEETHEKPNSVWLVLRSRCVAPYWAVTKQSSDSPFLTSKRFSHAKLITDCTPHRDKDSRHENGKGDSPCSEHCIDLRLALRHRST